MLAREKKGFTLTELILVVIIIGLLSGIVLPRLGGKDFFLRLALKTESQQIASDLRYVRGLAVSDTLDYTVAFDFTNHKYGIYKGTLAPENLVEEKTVSSDIDLSGIKQITFNSLGSALFKDEKDGLSLKKAGYQYNIKVEAINGFPLVEAAKP